MYLYNVTVGIDEQVAREWLTWMQEQHIPEILETGKFIDYKIFKVLVEPEDGTVSYSVQYFANTLEDVVSYLENHAPVFVEKHRKRYDGQHVVFQTLLEEITS